MKHTLSFLFSALVLLTSASSQSEDDKTVRVFVFAGQSNMVGADSKVADIERFPPFRGLGDPQPDVRFWHCIGRENKTTSDGWTSLQPVQGMVGPELSFARKVKANTSAPIAIIKIAAGGRRSARTGTPKSRRASSSTRWRSTTCSAR